MSSRPRRGLLAVVVSLSATVVWVSGAAYAGGNTSYTPGTPVLDTVQNGPWTLSQGDPSVGAPYSQSRPTYTPGGTPTQPGGFPNLAVYPGPNAPSGTPYASGVAGTPGPVDAYCTGSTTTPETGTQASEPAGTVLPMSPYYFPFVTQTPGDATQGHLTGYFDYRPKDTEEALEVARSTDGGQSWSSVDTVLEQNPENDCPTGDTNDNGQGHAFVMTVAGQSYLYMLNRPAGDNPGVGLLANPVSPSATDPVSGLPAVQSVGTDPDTFAAGAATVPFTGGTGVPIAVTTLGSGAETVGAGQFEDLAATSPWASVVSCTGTGASTLTGCTTANGSGLSVASGDPLVSVLGDATGAVTIPQGPNSTLENGGQTLSLSAPLSTITAANVPGRFYLDGATVYCVNTNSANQLSDCTTTQTGGVAVGVGDAVTTDPILPSSVGQPGGTRQTSGLIAPDGIVGVVPSSIGYPGAPGGSTVVIYGEKILNYFIVGTVATAVSLPSSTITVTPSAGTSEPIPATGPFTISLGSTAGSIQAVTCGAYSSGTLSGCSGGTGTVAAGNDVGGPGAAVASSATLGSIGEGSTKPKTLYKNNEDLTVLRAAYTTDGIAFTDLGAISGSDPSHVTDINDPAGQASPSTMDLAPGATDSPELRFVGTRGTIITNPDGSIGMFDSGAWESDGDSDAFNQIFYTSSTDGVHWTEPVVVESTDYTFSARQHQDAALAGGHDDPLDVSAYFAGRAYSPSVVQNPDGTLTLVFSGYSTPKPVISAGTVLGDGQGGAPPWTVGATDPALYRSILTVTLTQSPGSGLPEAPAVVLLPLAGVVVVGGAAAYVSMTRRRRLRTTRTTP